MIRRLQSNEYLKRTDNMSAAERSEYLGRVGEWLERQAPLLKGKMGDDIATFQNVLQCSALWNDIECKAMEEGIRLLSAMKGEETWLPDKIYSVAAARVIKKVMKILRQESVRTDAPASVVLPVKTPDQTVQAPLQKPAEEKTEKKLSSGTQPVPVRPKHIDQYVHLLPEATQKKAAQVQGLLRDMDDARENARLLSEAGEHPDKIAVWAKTVTNIDTRLQAIYKELDREWDNLVKEGRVMVDDFGNAHIVECPVEEKKDAGEKKAGRPPMTEEQKAAKKAEKDAKRLEYLKKWLRDTRTKDSPERHKLWKKNLKELLELGGELTDSIRRAAEFYKIPLDDVEPKNR